MLRETLFRLSQERHLRDVATHSRIAQKMARRFVAGETMDEAIEVIRAINRRGMSATLDHLGENVTSAKEACEATEAACLILRTISQTRVDCNISLKLTQLGLDLGDEVALANMDRILSLARELDNFVRIDMEGSPYTTRTLAIFERLFERNKNVGAVIQSYLYRSAEDIERLIAIGAPVRLVKGAYLEPVTIAFQRKEDVDANYLRLMEELLSRGNYPAIATHDEVMIDEAKRFAREHAIDPPRFEFQMLYGIRRDLQSSLVGDGYRMRVYVPYGTQWYPYLMRRMAERPANVMFVLGNLAREARG